MEAVSHQQNQYQVKVDGWAGLAEGLEFLFFDERGDTMGAAMLLARLSSNLPTICFLTKH